eukprot:g824.t1
MVFRVFITVVVCFVMGRMTAAMNVKGEDVLSEIVGSDSNTIVSSDILDVYASVFDKIYVNQEERNNALDNLNVSVNRIRIANREKHGSATFGLNTFSDIASGDFNSFYLNYDALSGSDTRPANDFNSFYDPTLEIKGVTSPTFLRSSTASKSQFDSYDSDVAGSLDWRDTPGVVSAVKNQNKCGSCWAFSAVETIESAYVLAGNEPRVLSTEQIVDCDDYDKGCTGGNLGLAFSYIKSVGGLLSRADYPDTSPDTGRTGACEIGEQITNDTMTSPLVQVGSYGFAVPPCMFSTSCDGQRQYEGELVEMLKKNGPASVCVSAQVLWQDYVGGVLDSPNCLNGMNSIDHCVQLVGYDADASPTPYWIVRNTWSANWGEEGYIRIAMGSNMCGILNEAMQVKASEGRDFLPDFSPGPGPDPEYENKSPCRKWIWDGDIVSAKFETFCDKTDLVLNLALIFAVIFVAVFVIRSVCCFRATLCSCCGRRQKQSHDHSLLTNDEPLLLSEDEARFVFASD